MIHNLSAINEFVQQVVEAIASNIKVDISVYNQDRIIIAGTGGTKCEVGKQYDPGSLTGRLLQSGKTFFVTNPGHCKECETCSRYGICEHFAVAAFPIQRNKQILGSFCLVATDKEQKQNLLNNKSNLFKFLDKMCTLIFSVLNEKEIENELTISLGTCHKVINTVQEGIIVTDNNNRIIQCNSNAIKQLELNNEDIIGQHISTILPSLNISSKKQKGFLAKSSGFTNKAEYVSSLALTVGVPKMG